MHLVRQLPILRDEQLALLHQVLLGLVKDTRLPPLLPKPVLKIKSPIISSLPEALVVINFFSQPLRMDAIAYWT